MNDMHFEMFKIRSALFVDDNLYLVNVLTRSSRIFSLVKSSPAQKSMFKTKRPFFVAVGSSAYCVCSDGTFIFLTHLQLQKIACLFGCLKKPSSIFFLMSEMVHIKAFIIPFTFCVKLMFKLERKWEPWQFR